MKFKTNAKCAGCSSAIIGKLETLAPAKEWDMDLSSPDKILTYFGEKNLDPAAVMEIVRKSGFQIEPLNEEG